MKILFDLSGCEHLHNAISIYGLRFLHGLKDNHYANIIILCNAQIYDYVQKLYPNYSCIKISLRKEKKICSVLLNYLEWKKLVKGIDCDLIFVPHVFSPFFCFLKHRKVVMVFHDLQGLKIYNGIRLWICRFIYPLSLMRCTAVITISDFVKQEVHKIYPFISQNKMHTIYNGVIIPNVEKEEFFMKKKYLLYVSSLMGYKNVITLLKAFNLIKDKIPHILVIIGKPTDNWKRNALPFIKAEHLESRVYHVAEPVSDEVLAQYYHHAELFIHPSLMEGFGYTPVEAAMYGVPVLTNKETALYEVTMGLLNYYESPTDEVAMSQQIMLLLQNPPTSDKLDEISKLFQAQYNNQKQAEKLYKLLMSLNSKDK